MGHYFQGMMDSTGAAVFVSIIFLFLLIIIAVSLIPGIIATRNKHPYAVWIWLLGTIGAYITGGLGWIAALVWALIPPKTLPVSSPTGFPNGSAANTWSPSTPANAAPKSPTVEEQLAELQRLLDSKKITKTEYEALRKKTLGI